MFHNVVVGKPIVNVSSLLAIDERDWEENEKIFSFSSQSLSSIASKLLTLTIGFPTTTL